MTARMQALPCEPERILVRAPNWLGDLVMSTPGFRALRRRFPGAHMTLHVRPGLEELVAGSPWFDEIRPVRSFQCLTSAPMGQN